MESKKSERNSETQYIFSLIEDAKTDLSNFNNAIIVNEERVKILDSLASMCFNYNMKEGKDPELFMQNNKAYTHPVFVTHTDRTLAQLKNTGSMRLITYKSIVDAVIEYEGYFEKLTNQQVWYESALNNLIESGMPVFNLKYLPRHGQELDKDLFYKTAKLNTTNKQLIIELGNRAMMYSSITRYYLILLKEGNERSVELIKILKNDNTNTENI